MRPNDTYGLEAISTLLTAMEDYKNSMVVIFAGYKKEMQYFLRANSGIFSRIGYSFEFPDYTPEELVEMFVKKMNQYGFLVDTSAVEKVLKLMEFFSAMEDFGNSRFVERVVTITINNRVKRSYVRHYNDITDEDIPEIKDLTQITAGWQNYNPDNYDGKEEKMRTAVHEAGHALVSVIVMPGSIKRISLNQNARSLGRTEILRGGTTTEKDLRGTLAVLFGGRNAERIFYQDHSTGCVHDILTAKKLATEMIDMYAMGEFGVTSSRDLLIEADRLSAKILQDHCEVLAAVAKALLESESGELSGEQLESCFKDLK